MRDIVLNDANVRLGGKDNLVYQPRINVSQWDGEAFLDIKYPKIDIAKIHTFDSMNGVASITQGDEQLKIWQLNEEVLELSLTFSSKPISNIIRFHLKRSKNINFWPQGKAFDPLLPGEIDGIHRIIPENVEGSFALYIPKRHHAVGQKNYKTGKFGHLYRWEVTDSKGRKAWCEPLVLDGDDLVIVMPGDFLEQADYPIVAMGAGDTFGVTSNGTNRQSFGSGTNAIGQLFDTHTATTGDNITTYHVYSNWAFEVGTMGVTVYSGASQQSSMDTASRAFAAATLTPSNEFPTLDWDTASVSQALTDSTEYAMAMGDVAPGGTELSAMYDSTPGPSNSASNHDDPALEATWAEGSTDTRKYSMYVTFTVASGSIRRNPLTGPFARPTAGPFG